MLRVMFGESAMSRTQVKLWHNRFKEDREDIDDDVCLVARTRQQPIQTLNQ